MYTFARVTTCVCTQSCPAAPLQCKGQRTAIIAGIHITVALQSRAEWRPEPVTAEAHAPPATREAEHQLHNSLHALLPSVPYLLAALDSAWQARAAYRPEMGGAACGAATPAAPRALQGMRDGALQGVRMPTLTLRTRAEHRNCRMVEPAGTQCTAASKVQVQQAGCLGQHSRCLPSLPAAHFDACSAVTRGVQGVEIVNACCVGDIGNPVTLQALGSVTIASPTTVQWPRVSLHKRQQQSANRNSGCVSLRRRT